MQVVYVHTSKADNDLDHLGVLATNNIRTKGVDVDIIINAVDSQLPTVTVRYTENNEQDSLTSDINSYLALLQGSAVTIDSGYIDIQDADSEDGQ